VVAADTALAEPAAAAAANRRAKPYLRIVASLDESGGLYSGMSPPGRAGFIAGNLKFKDPGEVPEYPLTEIFPNVMVASHGRKGLVLQRDNRNVRVRTRLGWAARPAVGWCYWRTTSTEHVA
jgi:hypothetical protein